jgi:hypothetical protein
MNPVGVCATLSPISCRKLESREPGKGCRPMNLLSLPYFFLVSLILLPSMASAQVPETIAVPNETLVATIHAEGAQVYECKADASGKSAWQFREPIATLLIGAETVGRHFAGPNWELADGSRVSAKVAGRAPGATAKDIPLLKLEVTSQHGTGKLTGVTTIQRLNTKGGVAEGPCETSGAFQAIPYSADYTFYKKAG